MQARSGASGGMYGDLGVVMNQYDKLKVSNVAQYIALMDVVTLKLCTQINFLSIKLIESPNTREYVNEIMECACFIAHHHKTIHLYVIHDRGETFQHPQRKEEALKVENRILRVSRHSI